MSVNLISREKEGISFSTPKISKGESDFYLGGQGLESELRSIISNELSGLKLKGDFNKSENTLKKAFAATLSNAISLLEDSSDDEKRKRAAEVVGALKSIISYYKQQDYAILEAFAYSENRAGRNPAPAMLAKFPGEMALIEAEYSKSAKHVPFSCLLSITETKLDLLSKADMGNLAEIARLIGGGMGNLLAMFSPGSGDNLLTFREHIGFFLKIASAAKEDPMPALERLMILYNRGLVGKQAFTEDALSVLAQKCGGLAGAAFKALENEEIWRLNAPSASVSGRIIDVPYCMGNVIDDNHEPALSRKTKIKFLDALAGNGDERILSDFKLYASGKLGGISQYKQRIKSY